MINDFREAYLQGRLDEKIEWRKNIRHLLNVYPDEEYISKKYIIKLFEGEDLDVVRIPKPKKATSKKKQSKSK